MPHSVYILYSERLDRFYTGETADFDKRKLFHDHALPHKFTANAKDWVLFLSMECTSKKQAIDIEAHIKKMKSSIYIRNLKKYSEMIQKLLDKYKI